MDRVDFSQGIENALNTGMAGGKRAETRRTARKNNTVTDKKVFSDLFDRSFVEAGDLGPLVSADPSDEKEQFLLDCVRSCGDNLKRRPLPQEMLEFKKAVRNFLHYVVENSYEIRPEVTQKKIIIRGEKRTEKKYYQQVRVVDQKLEELASGILLKQINELDLKSKLEEITGLLVDFTITGKISQDNKH